MKKWPIFDQNHGLTLLEFEKSQFFLLFEVVVFIAYKGVFFVLGYSKTHFSGLNCLRKKGGKIVIFWPKPWVKPSFFRLRALHGFYRQERRFLVLEYPNTSSCSIFLKIKKIEKSPIFDQNHWSFKNINFLTFWTCWLFSLEKFFFVLDYPKTLFTSLYCLKKKKDKKIANFWPKPSLELEKYQYCWLLAFFRSRIS